jgi:O-antigen/teichoic acid export membrane protein
VNFFFIDKKLFKEIFSFSGWGIIAGSAIALNTQGILLLLNYFFTPSVVAALRALFKKDNKPTIPPTA